MGDSAQAPCRGIPDETRREVDSDDGGDDSGDDDGVVEARVAKSKKSPKDPTKKEREEHELTHMPFRSWCEDCVKSRARNAHHRKKSAPDPLEEVKVARVHMDYFFLCPGKTSQRVVTRCSSWQMKRVVPDTPGQSGRKAWVQQTRWTG